MEIHEASLTHLNQWLPLRQKLWPPNESDDFEKEIKDIIESPTMTCFLVRENESYVGFAEVGIREYADGCSTKNVGYLEGIFIEPEHRKRGFAMALICKSEEWLVEQGCIEVASDTEIDNLPSLHFHKAAGFVELKPVVQFIKKLKNCQRS